MKKYLPVSAEEISPKELADYAPLTLGMVGDAVHTLFLRSYLLPLNRYKNSALHKEVSDFARAPSQAEDAKALFPLLTDDEKRIFNKAKNSKLNTVPKHATHYEYQLATAFEAVCGYLYLAGNNDRLAELFEKIYQNKLPKLDNSVAENANSSGGDNTEE